MAQLFQGENTCWRNLIKRFLLFQFPLQTAFFLSMAVSAGQAVDSVSMCVPSSNSSTGHVHSCREVSYSLQLRPHISCDEVCQSRGLLCTEQDHGFTDENVLNIFTSLLGKPCRTGFNTTDGWTRTGPTYLNYTAGSHERRCRGWKSIPKQIFCEAVPVKAATVRLCPCINDVAYHLSKESSRTCEQDCESANLDCTAEHHGLTDGNVLRIIKSLLGSSCLKGKLSRAYIDQGPLVFYNTSEKSWQCRRWENIPKEINCGFGRTRPNNRRILCPCVPGCSRPLGMKNGRIPDEVITSSSEQSFKTLALHGRLDMTWAARREAGGWCPKFSDEHQWLQVWLGSDHIIKKVATQGRHNHNQWVTSYTLSYSQDGMTFVEYQRKDNKVRVFQGNIDSNTVVINLLRPHIKARKIRVKPKTFHKWISMRIELYGCRTKEGRCDVDPSKRVDCGWGGITRKLCLNRGCCFSDTVRGTPWCFIGNTQGSTNSSIVPAPFSTVSLSPNSSNTWTLQPTPSQQSSIEKLGISEVAPTEQSSWTYVQTGTTGMAEISPAASELSQTLPSTSGIQPSTAVTYFLEGGGQSCDKICQKRGYVCTTTNHGFTNTSTLLIFKSNGINCKTGFNTDTYKYPDNPVYINDANCDWTGRCIGWLNIPSKFCCLFVAGNLCIQRLCPCIKDIVDPTSASSFHSPSSIWSLQPTPSSQLASEAPRLSTMVSLSEHTSTFSTPAGITEVSEISPSPTKVSEILPSKEIIQSEENAVTYLMSERNNVSTSTVLIKWERPRELLSGYKVSYKAIEIAAVPVSNATLHEVVLNGSSTTIQITGLESYTTYNITVTPIARSGVRMKSKYIHAETCRCPRQLKADWWVSPPYTIMTNQSAAGGVIQEVLSNMVREVCAQCPAHGHTDIDFQSAVRNGLESRKKRSAILPDPIGDYDLIFPVGRFLSQKTFEGYNYIPVVEVPGFVLMTVTRNEEFYAKVVASSLFDCWPYFIIYISMMLLAGIVLWILDSRSNPDHFPHSFIKGAWNGIWWSFVTMTTVGYGDRCPKSNLGRAFAITWFYVGLVINAMLISALTSSTSIKVIEETFHTKPGKTVGVLKDSPSEQFVGVLKKYGGTHVPFQNVTALADGLYLRQVDSVILDINVAGYRRDLFNNSWFTINKIIDYPFSFGAAVSHNAAKLERIFRLHLKENQAKVMHFVQNVGERNKTSDGKEDDELPTVAEQPTKSLLWTSVEYLGISIGVALVCGILFHLLWTRRRGKETKRNDAMSASRSVLQSRYLETKREMQLVVQEFRDNIKTTYNKLKARHLKERKKLIRLIKQENERHRLGMENNLVSPTPRARPVNFARNDLGIMTDLDMNIFEMEEFSGSPTMLKAL